MILVQAFEVAFSKAFAADVTTLSKKLKSQIDNNKEYIEEKDVIKAMNILNYAVYRNIADIFLGCAAINLVNAYVKQDDAKLNYEFRRHLIRILKAIEKVEDKNILVIYDDSKGLRILMIQIAGFQFSFKSERLSQLTKILSQKNKIPWDGMRKQFFATTIFNFALDSKYISNMTRKNESLREYLASEISNYEHGAYKFVNGKLVKTEYIESAHDMDDKYLKNYMRVKLCEPRNEPVILIGTFKKVWPKHVTFTTIRPYIKGIQTITICNHVNIKRTDLEKYIDLNSLVVNKKYYIIGYCRQYSDSNERMGVRLAMNLKGSPLIAIDSLRNISKDTFEKCYLFGIDDYISAKQRHLSL